MSSSKRLRSSSVSDNEIDSGVMADDSDDSLPLTVKCFDNWRHASKSNQRLALLFASELLADVVFKLDESKMIKAHRLILWSASDVFRQMFDNANQNSLTIDDNERKLLSIEVSDDCDYDALKRVIGYLYSDRIHINESNVMAIIAAANKFGVECVVDIGVDFACKQLTRNNCFDWFAKASDLGDCKLKLKCLEMIANNAQYVINCEAFLKINNSQLCELLARDDLFVDEYDLFNAVIRWCEANSNEQSFRNTAIKLRDIMGDAFYLIRFPTMIFANFCRILQIFSDLFKHEEMIAIIEYINVGTNPNDLRFSTKKRTNLY